MYNDHIIQYKPNYILKVFLMKKKYFRYTHTSRFSVWISTMV